MQRTSEQIIAELKDLLRSKGYIYSLCLLLFDEFHIIIDQIHEQSPHQHLSMNEALLIVGFLAQNDIDFSLPESPQALMKMKQKTKDLLDELHSSYHLPFMNELEKLHKGTSTPPGEKELFGRGDMLVEPIHYAGTGAYDFQLIRLIEHKYKFDLDWLIQKRGYSPQSAADFFSCVKKRLEEKGKRVNLFVRQMSKELREQIETSHPKEEVEQFFEASEIFQYADLFELEKIAEKEADTIREKGFENFCKNLLDLFVITREDVSSVAGGNILLELFSCKPSASTNERLQSIGSYNKCRSHPFLKIDQDRFFLPVTFILAEALYESPYYWMAEDKDYRNNLAKHRGDAGELLAFRFLADVFGKDLVYKSVKVEIKKGHTETDIDVLCILGNKGLCVQIKSKKLTELSRLGDDKQLQKDFQAGVQDAFNQGKLARKCILDRKATFVDDRGRAVKGIESVEEVYVLVVTTENYPSLAHQSRVLLQKEEADPLPMILTIFDLEIVAHYLKNPYEFLYYVRQRIALADQVIADEESVFLTYHLQNKLWKEPEVDRIALDGGLAEILSQDYLPKTLGIEVDPKHNPLASRWKDEEFDLFVEQLATHDHPKITDVVFHLLDLSGDMRKGFMKLIKETKAKSEQDGKMHSFSIPPDEDYSPRLGITFMSIKHDDYIGPEKRISVHAELSKYKHKGDIWVGFCGFIGSKKPLDFLVVIQRPWQYDEKLEEHAAHLGGTVVKTDIREKK
ncbi:MAG: hypothetical protein J0M15_16005 [Deltaproteobacteria bacterium]|nr:hypothetical protein [Deltaproteobacteria bacterium]